jgi:MFS family permease
MERQNTSIYTLQFWLLCSSNFLFCASFSMMIPELPDYLAAMGGKDYIGWIIALFTLTAGLARPFSGKLTDTIGRIPIMAIGSIVCFVCSGLYPFIHTTFALLTLRFFHGFSTGTKPTATAAYVADVIPENRRGEAQGMLGIFTAVGMSFGPTIGSYVTSLYSLDMMFYSSSVFALLSIVILLNMEEPLPKEKIQKFSFKLLKIKWIDIFEPRVIPVFVVMVLVSFASGVALTLAPNQSKDLGLDKSIYFTISTLSSLVIRFFFAKSSDKYGRIPVLMISSVVLVGSTVMFALSSTPLLFKIAATLFGFSWGFNTPTLAAWAVDLSDERYRGRAMATMYIALELGIGLGALLAGKFYEGTRESMANPYWVSGILAVLSFGYLWFQSNKKTVLIN